MISSSDLAVGVWPFAIVCVGLMKVGLLLPRCFPVSRGFRSIKGMLPFSQMPDTSSSAFTDKGRSCVRMSKLFPVFSRQLGASNL